MVNGVDTKYKDSSKQIIWGDKMKSKSVNQLEMQLKKTLNLLKKQYKKQPTSMLELIIKRYNNTLKYVNTINNEEEELIEDKINIFGSVRAYLDSASDYNNPILEEMNKTEKLFKEILNEN